MKVWQAVLGVMILSSAIFMGIPMYSALTGYARWVPFLWCGGLLTFLITVTFYIALKFIEKG